MEEKYLELIEMMNQRINNLGEQINLLKKAIDIQNETIDLLKKGFITHSKRIKELEAED